MTTHDFSINMSTCEITKSHKNITKENMRETCEKMFVKEAMLQTKVREMWYVYVYVYVEC